MIKGLPTKLKKLRSQYNLSQKDVARILRVSPSIISAYELGERTPSIDNILALSRLYHCSTDYLLNYRVSPTEFSLDTAGLNEKQVRSLQLLINTMR